VIGDWRSANFFPLLSSGPAGLTDCKLIASEAVVVTSSLKQPIKIIFISFISQVYKCKAIQPELNLFNDFVHGIINFLGN
jgi:hypothetical protein